MKKNQPIFKFMSVRAVESIDNLQKALKLIPITRHVSGESKFVKELKSTNINKRRKIAISFLRKHNKNLTKSNAHYHSIYNQVVALAADSESKIQETLSQLFSSNEKLFDESMRSDQWDAIMAITLCKNSFKKDPTPVVQAIRLFEIQLTLKEIDSAEKLSHCLKAVPVVPRELLKRGKAVRKKPEQPKPEKDELPEIVNKYDEALKELKIKERENNKRLSKIRVPQTTAKPARTIKKPDTNKITSTGSFHAESTLDPWALSPEIAKTISKTTLTLVKENGLDLTDRISNIYEDLERVQQNNIAELSQGKGVKDVMSIISGAPAKRKLSGKGTINKATSSAAGSGVPDSVGTVKPIGIGDLMIVEEELLRYETHEIAHVENIMESEYKERVHRVLEQQEESYLFESESSTETETDLQSTERYELQKEAETVIATEQEMNAGLSVSAGYGPVSISASAGYAVSNSFENSVSNSSSYAKEVTERSVTNIMNRVLEQSSSKTLTEIEETNTHGFDNKDGDSHVIGIYLFLNKIYRAQLYNYGKRLMFEFMIPEPSAFYKFALSNQSLPGMTLSMPDDDILTLSPSHITRTSYLSYVKMYQAEGINPPPKDVKYVAKGFHGEYNKESDYSMKSDNAITVPEGYYADSFNVDRTYGYWTKKDFWFLALVGDRRYDAKDGEVTNKNLSELTGTVPVVVNTGNLIQWGLTVEIKCRLTTEEYQKWQLETYNALLDAYYNLKSEYEEQLAAAKSAAGVGVYGQSDEMNRVTEQTELQRSCLTLLTDQHFDLFDAMDYSGSDGPQMDVDETMTEGPYVQFFQQSFEWDSMTYTFYPYFWGDKDKWLENMNIQNSDTKFQDFLKAGFARVLVPVRPHYEETIMHYLETGEIWEGGEAPAIDDDMYVSILEELYDLDEEKIAVGDPWELTVPTNLVYLKPDETLPDYEQE